MPSGWQTGIIPAPNNLLGLLVTQMVPAFLRQTYLLGVTLGVAWNGASGDAAMQQLLNGIIGDVQDKLGIRFQVQRVLTDPAPGLVKGVDYELLGERLAFNRPIGQSAYYVPLPYANVTSIQRVRMYYGNQLVYQMPTEWVHFTSKEGVLKLIPVTMPALIPGVPAPVYGFLWGYNFHEHIPNVWSVDYTIGHGQIDADIAHYIGLTAAIQVLALAGAGSDITGGLASETLSQDGISESVSYAQGKYGIYSGLIQTYQDELARIDILKKRLKKSGMKVMVI